MRKQLWAIFAAILLVTPALAQEVQDKKLPVPRFVSLKSDKVNVRQGPSREHDVLWIYNRAGLPVEIIAEFEIWRKIRDSEGAEGWVLQNLLSGKRTVMVAPWLKSGLIPLYAKPEDVAAIAVRLESSVVAQVKSCNKKQCRIIGEEFDGFIAQDQLFGVYPNEEINE